VFGPLGWYVCDTASSLPSPETPSYDL